MAWFGTGGATKPRLVVAGVVAALVVLAVAGRLERHALTPRSAATAPAPPPVATTTTVPRPSPVAARVHLALPGDFAQGTFRLAVGEGGVWVVLAGSLLHVDPSGRLVARVRIGGPQDFVGSLLAGAGAVWVQTQAGVARVDPRSNRVVRMQPADPLVQLVSAGADGLWSWRCADQNGTGPCWLLRLDPRTLAVTARIRLPVAPAQQLGPSGPVGPAAMVVGTGSAWLVEPSGSGPRVWRVRLGSGQASRVGVPGSQLAPEYGRPFIALGSDAVWVAADWVETPTPLGSRVGAGLIRIDPATMRVTAAAPLDNLDSVTGLAVSTGAAWVYGRQSTDLGGVLDRVDATTARLTGAVETHAPAFGIPFGMPAAGFGSLWLLQPETGDLVRLDPRRV